MGDRVAGVAVGAAKRHGDVAIGAHGEDEQQLLEIGAVRFGPPVRDRRGGSPADLAPARAAIAATEADRRGVVVELVETHTEALPDGQDEFGEQRSTVGIEQVVQGPSEAVVAQVPHLLGADAEHAVGEAVHRLLLAVDGLTLDDDGAQQHAQCAGVTDGATPVRGHEARQRLGQPDALDEVIDQGQRAQALGVKSEARPLHGGSGGLRARHAGDIIIASNTPRQAPMPSSVAQRIEQTREKIRRIRAALTEIEYLCSGTLHQRTKVCGRPTCRCAQDPSARHGPYYEWGHLRDGKLVHRVVTPEQARLLQQAIDNQRHAKKLMRAWEEQTERLIDLEAPRQP